MCPSSDHKKWYSSFAADAIITYSIVAVLDRLAQLVFVAVLLRAHSLLASSYNWDKRIGTTCTMVIICSYACLNELVQQGSWRQTESEITSFEDNECRVCRCGSAHRMIVSLCRKFKHYKMIKPLLKIKGYERLLHAIFAIYRLINMLTINIAVSFTKVASRRTSRAMQ